MKLINSTLLALTLNGWLLFFICIWEMQNYWAVAVWFLTMIAITAGYVLTKPSSIKTMTEDKPFTEQENGIEYFLPDEPADWQECYEIAEKDEFNREADRIIKEVSEACYKIGRGEADV